MEPETDVSRALREDRLQPDRMDLLGEGATTRSWEGEDCARPHETCYSVTRPDCAAEETEQNREHMPDL